MRRGGPDGVGSSRSGCRRWWASRGDVRLPDRCPSTVVPSWRGAPPDAGVRRAPLAPGRPAPAAGHATAHRAPVAPAAPRARSVEACSPSRSAWRVTEQGPARRLRFSVLVEHERFARSSIRRPAARPRLVRRAGDLSRGRTRVDIVFASTRGPERNGRHAGWSGVGARAPLRARQPSRRRAERGHPAHRHAARDRLACYADAHSSPTLDVLAGRLVFEQNVAHAP